MMISFQVDHFLAAPRRLDEVNTVPELLKLPVA